jgi:hypothetical protein
MFTKSGEWTDPFKVVHTDAVFQVCSADISENKSENFNFNLADGEFSSNSNENSNLNYRMYFWTNLASKDAGTIPWVLPNVDELSEQHRHSGLDASFDGMNAEESAEHHCQTLVLI